MSMGLEGFRGNEDFTIRFYFLGNMFEWAIVYTREKRVPHILRPFTYADCKFSQIRQMGPQIKKNYPKFKVSSRPFFP